MDNDSRHDKLPSPGPHGPPILSSCLACTSPVTPARFSTLCSSPAPFSKFLTLAKLPQARGLCKCYSFCLEHSSLTFLLSQLLFTLQTSGQMPLLGALADHSDGASCLSRALRAPCFSSHVARCHCHFPVCLYECVTTTISPQQTAQCLFLIILTLNPQDLVSAWY